jgi:2-dehydro-3-deoxygalactonokinase
MMAAPGLPDSSSLLTPGGFDTVFIGVDWGTSNGRFLLIEDGKILQERSAPGIKQLGSAEAIENTCFEIAGPWLAENPALRILMAGMAGSNIGWQPAPYTMTPASAASMVSKAVRFTARGIDCIILPGVETTGSSGLPDVMRGEETQIFGAMGHESGLVCLPGTHAKWALIDDGMIMRFHTAMTGEIMDIIGRNSILLTPARAPMAEPGAAFLDGVTTARDNAAGLEVLLFTIRSRQIAGTLSSVDAEACLAGLCIGADIRSALLSYQDVDLVRIIGSPALTALYAAALDCYGVASREIDGQKAVVDGLSMAHRMLTI